MQWIMEVVAWALFTEAFINIQCMFVCQLSVKGYNDKQHILLKKIIEKIASFEIDEKRFDIMKEAVRYTSTL